eukprot:Em0005g536a
MGNDLTSIMKQLARGYNLSQIYAGWWGEVQWDGFVIVVIAALLWLVNVLLTCLEHFETLASTLRCVVEDITTLWPAAVHNWSMLSNRGLTNVSCPSGNVTANDGSFETLLSSVYIHVGGLLTKTCDQFLEKLPAAVSSAALLGGGTVITSGVLYCFAWVYHRRYNMTNSVKKRFLNPNPPPLIREGEHFPREKEEKEIQKAFLMDQTDSLGLVGVVFGPAGTGKSNVVRTVCRSNTKGVIYMEIGSPRQFPYHLAKACGVPVEPNWWDAVVAKLFGTFRTYVTLPSSDQDALALVLPIIAEGAKAYIKKNKSIPVLFIDGVDILAKEEDNRLYVNLVDWAKKCANEDSLRIVLVCSDSHVLVLDQQSFKSRLDALIEIDDASETQAVNELMIEKYKFPTDLATSTYNIVGGRLADIHKMVSIRRRGYSVIPQEVVKATERFETADALRVEIHKTLNDKIANPNEDKSNEIEDESKRMLIRDIITSYNFKQQFIREMEQVLCKALGKDKHVIKKFIIQQVLGANGTKTVEEIAFLYHDSTKIHEVIDAIKELLRYNVLRITKNRVLRCYNKTAKEVLKARKVGAHVRSS